MKTKLDCERPDEQPADTTKLDCERLVKSLTNIVGPDNVHKNEPMSAHTTMRVGGPAAIYVIPEKFEDLERIISVCGQAQAPYFILGRGSDLIVSDAGYQGVVIAIADGLTGVTAGDTTLTCEAGCTLAEAAEMACELGLSGLEFASGIPGSVGGAVYMNAGAYDGCIADVVSSARVLTPTHEILNLSASELAFGYRSSRVRDEGLIVLAATFALSPAEPTAIRATMDNLAERRSSKQPLELPSAGSTFKRPEGHFAGKLISDAGCKGYQVGGAAISTKHAGFVVNLGGATAADVVAVIEHVQAEVLSQFGVELEPEVQFLGMV